MSTTKSVPRRVNDRDHGTGTEVQVQSDPTPTTRLRWTSTSGGSRHLVGLPQFYVSRHGSEWEATVQGHAVGRLFPTGAAAQRAVEAHVAGCALLQRWTAKARS